MTDPNRFDALLLDTAPTAVLAASLRHAGNHDTNTTAGLHALLGYNHGALLDSPAIRAHIAPTGDGPIISWSDLGNAATTAATHSNAATTTQTLRTLARLGHPSLDVVLYACSLAADTTVCLRNVAHMDIDKTNRAILVEAFTISLSTPSRPTRFDPGE